MWIIDDNKQNLDVDWLITANGEGGEGAKSLFMIRHPYTADSTIYNYYSSIDHRTICSSPFWSKFGPNS